MNQTFGEFFVPYILLAIFAWVFFVYAAKPRIKTWYYRYRERRDHQAYLDGYGWAWAAYAIEHTPIRTIEAYCLPKHFRANGPSPFDSGARQALDDIEFFDSCSGGNPP